jgi:hypothetical protein
MSTLSKQLDKLYTLAEQHKLGEAAEFLKGFIIKWDVIKNNTKVKRGNTTHKVGKQNTVL